MALGSNVTTSNLLELGVSVNGQLYRALLDSGATHNFVSACAAGKACSSNEAEERETPLSVRLANGIRV